MVSEKSVLSSVQEVLIADIKAVVLAKVSKEAPLQCHFNALFGHPRVLAYKADKLVESNLISTCVVNGIPCILRV